MRLADVQLSVAPLSALPANPKNEGLDRGPLPPSAWTARQVGFVFTQPSKCYRCGDEPAPVQVQGGAGCAAGTRPNETLFHLDGGPGLTVANATTASGRCSLCGETPGCTTWSFTRHWTKSDPHDRPCHLSTGPPICTQPGVANSTGGSSSTARSRCRPGWKADPLLDMPANGMPVVAANSAAAAWLDLCIPETAVPGRCGCGRGPADAGEGGWAAGQGCFVLSAADPSGAAPQDRVIMATIPIVVEVWNLTMPRLNASKSFSTTFAFSTNGLGRPAAGAGISRGGGSFCIPAAWHDGGVQANWFAQLAARRVPADDLCLKAPMPASEHVQSIPQHPPVNNVNGGQLHEIVSVRAATLRRAAQRRTRSHRPSRRSGAQGHKVTERI